MNNRPIIIGGGAAGLMAALCLAPRPVVLMCGGGFGVNAASQWAQGGIAAAVGADDNVDLHVADTLAAGAGLCDPQAVARIIAGGAWVIETLLKYGAQFGRTPDGGIELGLEAAHSRHRIVHAKDATGAEVMRVLMAAVRATPSITVLEHAQALQLLVHENRLQGVRFSTPAGQSSLASACVVLATGGVGGLFSHTTNPASATGAGLALAARAGADLRDIEFVQFHPTAFDCGLDPMPLISEALRGEGAVFVDEAGTPFMQGQDLAARDIVARAVAAQYARGGRAFLDARGVNAQKFPGIFENCRQHGMNPARQPIPVRPAAHYHMGGVAVNADGETSIAGLFACGEVAATGLHGANRLASNSLLEAMVGARDTALAINSRDLREALPMPARDVAPLVPGALPVVRQICTEHLGILRNAEGLAQACAQLAPLAARSDPALVALLMADAALRRQESRGAQWRTDYPATSPAFAHSTLSHIRNLEIEKIAA